MNQLNHAGQNALKYELEVQDHGRLELLVPLDAGSRVVVFVVPEVDEIRDELVVAAQSSLAFWDNVIDDEEWNEA